MKSFVAAMIIVITLVVLIIINAFCTANIIEELFLSLKRLNETKSSEDFYIFTTKWNNYLTYLSLTVTRDSLQTVQENLNLMSCCLSELDKSTFSKAISNIETALVEIFHFSAFKFTNIL